MGLESEFSIFDMDLGMIFCLVDVPDRNAVENHHSKFGVKCDWITPVKMTSEYGDSKWRLDNFLAMEVAMVEIGEGDSGGSEWGEGRDD